MLQLRRAAFRLLSTPSTSFVARSRSVSSIKYPTLRLCRQSFAPSPLQRRWASEDAPKGLVGEGGEVPVEEGDPARDAVQDQLGGREDISGDVPVKKVAPAPEEEVENAIQNDDKVGASPQQESRSTLDAVKEKVFGAAQAAAGTAGGQKADDTLYLGNLFFDVSEKDVMDEFSRFGASKVKIIRDSRGLSKGFGYISFESPAQATKAQEAMNQTVFEGRRLTVQFAQRSIDTPKTGVTTNPPSKTLFIGNMSFEMTDRDLNELFKGIRNVIDVRVAVDRRTGQPRGFAHADFIDVKSAVEALQILREKSTYGRKLRIDYSTSKRTQGEPGAGGAQ